MTSFIKAMLTPYRPQFIEKIMTDASGRRFRVLFAVSFVNGEVRGRVISAEPIEHKSLELRGESYEKSTETLCLPYVAIAIITPTSYLLSPALFISPFSELFFFTSQPTRAPNK